MQNFKILYNHKKITITDDFTSIYYTKSSKSSVRLILLADLHGDCVCAQSVVPDSVVPGTAATRIPSPFRLVTFKCSTVKCASGYHAGQSKMRIMDLLLRLDTLQP